MKKSAMFLALTILMLSACGTPATAPAATPVSTQAVVPSPTLEPNTVIPSSVVAEGELECVYITPYSPEENRILPSRYDLNEDEMASLWTMCRGIVPEAVAGERRYNKALYTINYSLGGGYLRELRIFSDDVVRTDGGYFYCESGSIDFSMLRELCDARAIIKKSDADISASTAALELAMEERECAVQKIWYDEDTVSGFLDSVLHDGAGMRTEQSDEDVMVLLVDYTRGNQPDALGEAGTSSENVCAVLMRKDSLSPWELADIRDNPFTDPPYHP